MWAIPLLFEAAFRPAGHEFHAIYDIHNPRVSRDFAALKGRRRWISGGLKRNCLPDHRINVKWYWQFPLIACSLSVLGASSPHDIVERSVRVTQQDWSQAPNYSYIDREVKSEHGHARHTRTDRVRLIDGSPYNELIAINDEALSKEQARDQARKLARETERREHESPADHKRRIASYERERTHDHQMLSEMIKAFDFTPAGEGTLGTRRVWVVDAAPKPGYVPHNHEGKVLQHMRGKLWIDQATYQWVKVEAEVDRPVSFYGFLARVKPGTRFELTQAPVAQTLWLPSRLVVTVKATALGIRNESSYDEDDYRDYQPQTQKVARAANPGGN